MFRPVPMMRLHAVVLARDGKTVLRHLGDLGAVQLSRTAASDETAPNRPPDRSLELARYDRVLARVMEIRRVLELRTCPAASASAPALTEQEVEGTLAAWEERSSTWARRRDEAQRQKLELEIRSSLLEPYRTLDVPLDNLSPSSFLHFVTGTLPAGGELEASALGYSPVFLLPLSAKKGRQPVLAVTLIKERANVNEALQRVGFQRESLPALENHTPEECFERTQVERETQIRELDNQETERGVLVAEAGSPLATIERWADAERRLIEAEQLFPGTKASVFITGWIPARQVKAVESDLRRWTQGCCAVEVSDAREVPEEDVPVLLQHSRWLRPFQVLVTAYGLPRYGELAPTLFVAISYVVMFGMMFGDVGHGSLVALAGAILMTASGAGARRQTGALMLANGLSSALFGAIYGSYFGIPQLKRYALWRDPLEGDPMALMELAIGIGVLLMSIGLGFNIINRLRRGELVEGLLDKFGILGVVFYWGALTLASKSALIQAQGWWHWAWLLVLAVPIGCWVVKEPLHLWWHQRLHCIVNPGDGMIGAVTESLVGAFEGVLLYLANTISFVRLAAYAMSHAALLMAAFTLAEQVRSSALAGPALAMLIIILGNIVAMVLEGIVAAVQALRLEYYEFFGKFYSGAGRPFRPFSLAGSQFK
jgi:V/A-type H+-transporting ATPase subunit I